MAFSFHERARLDYLNGNYYNNAVHILRLEATKQPSGANTVYDKLLVFDTTEGQLKILPIDINSDVERGCLESAVMGEFENHPATVGSDYRIIINPVVQNAYSAPFKIYMDLTYRCNATCPFCLYRNTGGKNTLDLNWETCKNIIKNASEVGVFAFKFGGGEPMLYPHFWEAVELSRSLGLFVSTSTNSLLFNDSTAKKILDHGIKISISVEGLKDKDEEVRGLGHFDKAINAVITLKKLGCNVFLQTNVMPRTFDDIPGLVKIAESLGVILKLRYIKPVGRAFTNGYRVSFEDADRYLKLIMYLNRRDVLPHLDLDESLMIKQPKFIEEKLYRGIMCGAGNRTLHINPEGKISPCIFVGDTYVAGKLGDDGNFMSFWHEIVGAGFGKIRSILKPVECRYCSRICAYECPALRLHGEGSNDLQGVNCLMAMLAHASDEVRKEFNIWLEEYEQR